MNYYLRQKGVAQCPVPLDLSSMYLPLYKYRIFTLVPLLQSWTKLVKKITDFAHQC